jgi:hypothetical protein
MVRASLEWLSSMRRCKVMSDEVRKTLRHACMTLKRPPSVAGPRSTDGSGGPHNGPTPRPSEADSGSRRVAPPEEKLGPNGVLDLEHMPFTSTTDGRGYKVHDPLQEVAPSRDVPNENSTTWVNVQENGDEHDTSDSNEARSDIIHGSHICPHLPNGGAALRPEAEDATSGRDVPEEMTVDDTEIVRGAFFTMVDLARKTRTTDRTTEILTAMAGLLHEELPKDLLQIQQGSSS